MITTLHPNPDSPYHACAQCGSVTEWPHKWYDHASRASEWICDRCMRLRKRNPNSSQNPEPPRGAKQKLVYNSLVRQYRGAATGMSQRALKAMTQLPPEEVSNLMERAKEAAEGKRMRNPSDDNPKRNPMPVRSKQNLEGYVDSQGRFRPIRASADYDPSETDEPSHWTGIKRQGGRAVRKAPSRKLKVAKRYGVYVGGTLAYVSLKKEDAQKAASKLRADGRKGVKQKMVGANPVSGKVPKAGWREQFKKAARVQVSRSRNPRGGSGGEVDSHGATELEMYITQSSELYPRRQAIEANLAKKMAKGTYRSSEAPKLWKYLVDDGAKRYAREFASPGNWNRIFDVPTRNAVARSLAASFEAEAPYRKQNPGVVRNPRHEGVPHDYQDLLESFDYRYSHTTPIWRRDGSSYDHHTFKHVSDDGVNLALWYTDGHGVAWSGSKGGSGRHYTGYGLGNLRDYLTRRARREGLSKSNPGGGISPQIRDLVPAERGRGRRNPREITGVPGLTGIAKNTRIEKIGDEIWEVSAPNVGRLGAIEPAGPGHYEIVNATVRVGGTFPTLAKAKRALVTAHNRKQKYWARQKAAKAPARANPRRKANSRNSRKGSSKARKGYVVKVGDSVAWAGRLKKDAQKAMMKLADRGKTAVQGFEALIPSQLKFGWRAQFR
jgi:hypothetical protein